MFREYCFQFVVADLAVSVAVAAVVVFAVAAVVVVVGEVGRMEEQLAVACLVVVVACLVGVVVMCG